MMSAPVFGMKRICVSIAIMLVGVTCFAGEDKKFVEAQAELVNKTTVAVWSDKVEKPVAARFAWSSRPYVNLWTASGLPVGPFRTDDWPLKSLRSEA